MAKSGTSWKPGQSGNPEGRTPNEEALTEVLRTLVCKEDIAKKLIEVANKGDVTALKYVYDRLDGKPRETVHNINENLPEVVEIDLSETDTDSSDAPPMEE